MRKKTGFFGFAFLLVGLFVLPLVSSSSTASAEDFVWTISTKGERCTTECCPSPQHLCCAIMSCCCP